MQRHLEVRLAKCVKLATHLVQVLLECPLGFGETGLELAQLDLALLETPDDVALRLLVVQGYLLHSRCHVRGLLTRGVVGLFRL